MSDEGAGDVFEMVTALTLAVLAAVLAVSDLGAGKYGDDEILGTNEKSAAYAWYQSKSIKQGQVEAERDLLAGLIQAGAVQEALVPAIQAEMAKQNDEVKRYKAEKKEILEGSAAVGPEGQVLDKDGEKGKIVGAKEWEAQLSVLGEAGDAFDLSALYLQLSLVMGTIALVLKRPGLRWTFYASMVLLGAAGCWYATAAFGIAAGA
jgi:hypothetical protein